MSKEPLEKTLYNLLEITKWMIIIGLCLTLLVLMTVFSLLVYRRQLLKLTLSIKISLILYLLLLTFSLILFSQLYQGQNSTINWVVYTLVCVVFALNHWIFSWHYFEAACLFRLSFGEHSTTSIERLKKRKKLLRWANFVTLTSICMISGTEAIMTYMEIHEDK